jgi:hypothetical protein
MRHYNNARYLLVSVVFDRVLMMFPVVQYTIPRGLTTRGLGPGAHSHTFAGYATDCFFAWPAPAAWSVLHRTDCFFAWPAPAAWSGLYRTDCFFAWPAPAAWPGLRRTDCLCARPDTPLLSHHLIPRPNHHLHHAHSPIHDTHSPIHHTHSLIHLSPILARPSDARPWYPSYIHLIP